MTQENKEIVVQGGNTEIATIAKEKYINAIAQNIALVSVFKAMMPQIVAGLEEGIDYANSFNEAIGREKKAGDKPFLMKPAVNSCLTQLGITCPQELSKVTEIEIKKGGITVVGRRVEVTGLHEASGIRIGSGWGECTSDEPRNKNGNKVGNDFLQMALVRAKRQLAMSLGLDRYFIEPPEEVERELNEEKIITSKERETLVILAQEKGLTFTNNGKGVKIPTGLSELIKKECPGKDSRTMTYADFNKIKDALESIVSKTTNTREPGEEG